MALHIPAAAGTVRMLAPQRVRRKNGASQMKIAHVTVFVYRRQKIAEIRVFSNARLSTSVKHAEAFIRKTQRRVEHDAFIHEIKQEQI
jgi:hypothetical protein